MRKKFLLVLFATAIFSRLSADSYFSGETGISTNFVNKRVYGFKPAININGFFSGQLEITNSLSVRTSFSTDIADLSEHGITKEADSKFQINELSATYTKPFAYANHSLTIFRGHFEPIGSQQFIQRHLGVKNYASPLTEQYLGNNDSAAYDLYGIGGCYSVTPKFLPLSAGLAISRNNETDDEPEVNADLRLAVSLRYLTADFLIGLGAPIYTKNDAGQKIFLLIDTAYLHSGLDMLIGSRYSFASLYTLAGFEYYTIRSAKQPKIKLEGENTFLLIEPRFKVGKVGLYISGFNIPESKLDKFFFIDNTLGANARLFYSSTTEKNQNFSVGVNGTVGLRGKYIDDMSLSDEEKLEDILDVKISPFTEFEALNGTLKIMIQVNAMRIQNEEPGAVKFNIGYKKEL